MRQLYISTFLAGITLAPVSANAQMGSEIATSVTAGAQLSDAVSLSAMGSVFWSPTGGSILIYYLGPDFQIGEHYNLGLKASWPNPGDAPLFLSAWQTLLFRDGRYSLFAETDLVFAGDGLHYIGVYSADWNCDLASLGVHGEQFGTAVTTGPHLNFNLGEHLTTGLQYHWLIGDTVQTMRLTITVKL